MEPCQHGNKPAGSMKGGESLDSLKERDFGPCSWVIPRTTAARGCHVQVTTIRMPWASTRTRTDCQQKRGRKSVYRGQLRKCPLYTYRICRTSQPAMVNAARVLCIVMTDT